MHNINIFRAVNQFSSQSEQDKQNMDKYAKKKRVSAYFQALDRFITSLFFSSNRNNNINRANRPIPIYLSSSLRNRLELMLGLLSSSQTSYNDVLPLSDVIVSIQMDGLIPPELCQLSIELQVEVVKDVVQHVHRKGFKDKGMHYFKQ